MFISLKKKKQGGNSSAPGVEGEKLEGEKKRESEKVVPF